MAKPRCSCAKYIRDKKGNAEPLFTDKKLLLEFVVRQITERAKESAAMKTVQEQVASLQAMGGRLRSQLPGGSKEELEPAR
jgi:hypothetical protein